jgi:hypothetical protein
LLSPCLALKGLKLLPVLRPDLNNYNLGLNMFENRGPRRCLTSKTGRDHLGDPGIDRMIIFKWILNMVLRNKLDTTNLGNPRIM